MEIYALKDNDLLLDADAQRSYVLKIRDMASEDKPRERLVKYGPLALSVAELLAIVLGTGSKQEDVLEMAHRVVKEYGESALVGQRDAAAIAEDLGIPEMKAMQIVACGELGRRFFEKKESGLAVIRNAQDVYNYLRCMESLPKEHLRGIYLDTHHRVIHDEIISIGTINSNLIHPREVFRPAIEHNAAGIILAHNHPSGVVAASQADIEVTEQLVEVGKIVGINLLDHVIISKGAFGSIDIDYSI